MSESKDKDSRSLGELIGDIPRSIAGTVKKTEMVSDKERLNAAERAIKLQVQALGREHAAEMLMIQIELARNSPNEAVRLDAAEKVLNRTIGKVPNMAFDVGGGAVIPQFNIIFQGVSPVVTQTVEYQDVSDED